MEPFKRCRASARDYPLRVALSQCKSALLLPPEKGTKRQGICLTCTAATGFTDHRCGDYGQDHRGVA